MTVRGSVWTKVSTGMPGTSRSPSSRFSSSGGIFTWIV
jgi:hypothetical protein